MKRIFLMTLVAIALIASNLWANENSGAGKEETVSVANENETKSDQVGNEKIYVCPMCPGMQAIAPGKCPKCGMDLVETSLKTEEESKTAEQMENQIKSESVDKHAGHSHTEDANEVN